MRSTSLDPSIDFIEVKIDAMMVNRAIIWTPNHQNAWAFTLTSIRCIIPKTDSVIVVINY